MIVWVCGRVLDYERNAWEIQGVFSTEAGAVAACRDETYFVGPETVDLAQPHESITWPGAYYPHRPTTP